MFLTHTGACFTMLYKPSGLRGCRWVLMFLAFCLALPIEGATSGRDGFDKMRMAPNVEFLDGSAIDLLVGLHKEGSSSEDLLAGKSDAASVSSAALVLSDLLVDSDSESGFENLSWSDGEEEPIASVAITADDLDPIEDILDLENQEPAPSEPPSESQKGSTSDH